MAMRKLLAVLVIIMVALGCGCTTPSSSSASTSLHRPVASFDFALIGDMPYDAPQTTNFFPKLIAELNRLPFAFVVHDGDIKSGATPCTDELFEERQRQFASFESPLIYVFGDNEWTDCVRLTNGINPMERLQKLRDMFTPGDESLGRRKLKLTRQSEDPRFGVYRENVRWILGEVVFIALNVPGASNNYGQPEFAARNAANLAWIKDSFALARQEPHRAIMLIIQANPFPERGSTNQVHPGFKTMLEVIERETIAFGKPVVLVHGDSHYFRIDRPLAGSVSKRRLENFTRVETFGNPDMHWVQVTVDPDDPDIFTFRPRTVPGNRVAH
jgi:hypothetical protein